MKLYGMRGTRSSRTEWLLQELGAKYEFVNVDLTKGEHKQPAHGERHPHSLVPALEDDKTRIIESAAACLYLADKFADKHLAPAPTSPERAKYYQLAVYAISTLDETVLPIFFHTVLLPPDKRKPELVEQKKATWSTAAKFLSRELGDGPFFLGKSFSAADVIVGYDLAIAAKLGLLEAFPTLKAYTERLTSREAFKKAHVG